MIGKLLGRSPLFPRRFESIGWHICFKLLSFPEFQEEEGFDQIQTCCCEGPEVLVPFISVSVGSHRLVGPELRTGCWSCGLGLSIANK